MILKEGQVKDSVWTLASSSTESSSIDLTRFSDSESSSSTHSSSKLESPLRPLPPPTLPPRYSTLQQQQLPRRISYTFMPQTNPANCMIMEPLDNHNILPSFYISVNMNCFVAFSYITTIRKGGWDGEIIGDFELDIHGARKLGTVSLFGYEQVMDDVFGVIPKMFRAESYHWSGRGRFGQNKSTSNLCWEEISAEGSPSILSCFPEKGYRDKTEIARLSVPNALRRPGSSKEFTRVDIAPDKCSCLEEIVVSLLLVERFRRTSTAVNRSAR